MAAAMLTALLIALVTTAWARRPESQLYMLDVPNQRSLHVAPTPRGGGMAMIAGILAGQGLLFLSGAPGGFSLPVLIAITLLTVVALFDDRGHVRVRWRLLIQALAAALALGAGLAPEVIMLPGLGVGLSPAFAGGLAFLFILWMTNLYNFMDGMDGLAGGMGVFGFGFLGLAGWLHGDTGFAVQSWVIAAAALGFLRFNFPPAQIFMGDAGSTVFGFLAAVLILQAQQRGLLPVWCGILIFSPFVVDATVTLIRRVLRGDAIWIAHRSHYYQRLVTLGWSHRRVALREYLLMLACGISALYVSDKGAMVQVATGVAWVVIYVVLASDVNRREKGIGA